MIKVEKWKFTVCIWGVCIGYVLVIVEKAHRKYYSCCACMLIRSGAAPSHELIIRHLYAIPPSALIARQLPAALAFFNNTKNLILRIASSFFST